MSTNWFTQGGQAYARHRPDYPPELAATLAQLVAQPRVALDVGCGNGQLTVQLAQHVDQVIGIDPSQDQIDHAESRANIRYLCAPAEQLPLPDQSVDLITAAQAAHWFDMPAFCAEVQRVARPGAVVALITYGVLHVDDPEIDRIVQGFYTRVIGPYWPAERRHVENGYRELYFPFRELEVPAMAIRRRWDLQELVGYVGTWSAVKAAERVLGSSAMLEFGQRLEQVWGHADVKRGITWPLAVRAGRMNA